MAPFPWAWQPADRAAATEGGDGNQQGGECHPKSSLRHWFLCLGRAGCVADSRGRVCLGSALACPALHTQFPPWCFPHLHTVKTHAAFAFATSNMLGPCFHAWVGNVILFTPLDLSSDPCYSPLWDTRRTFFHK